MIATLPQQLNDRCLEVLDAHRWLPICTSPLTQSLFSQEAVQWAMNGDLTHIMYVKDGKIYVGWVDSTGLRWFFDAWAT